MSRRKRGDPNVEPWEGSADQRESDRQRAERERASAERRDAALRAADFSAAETAYDADAVRRVAEMNAEVLGDLERMADRLNAEGVQPLPGEEWTAGTVSTCIALLWPHDMYASWPSHQGTYPGYLGPMREDLRPVNLAQHDILGARRHQYSCSRCGARWPTGWPGTEADEGLGTCPDCGSPNAGTGLDQRAPREHSAIDVRWLMWRYAPEPAGPCPVCGGPRRLLAHGYIGPERSLAWTCGSKDALDSRGRADGHYASAVERARWESDAAHYAYWLAVDMVRQMENAGEEVDVAIGATYEAMDGSGNVWILSESDWQRSV